MPRVARRLALDLHTLAEVFGASGDEPVREILEWPRGAIIERHSMAAQALARKVGKLGVGIQLADLDVNVPIHTVEKIEHRGTVGEEGRVEGDEASEQVAPE